MNHEFEIFVYYRQFIVVSADRERERDRGLVVEPTMSAVSGNADDKSDICNSNDEATL